MTVLRRRPAISVVVSLCLLAGCAGGGSTGSPVPSVASSPSTSGAGGTGQGEPNLNNLTFALYFADYATQGPPAIADQPLAVNSTTTSMYAYDVNYHWIRWQINSLGQLVAATYQPASYTTQSGTAITGGDAYAFDATGVLYTLAHDATSEYLVAHAENTGTPAIVPLNVAPAHVHDMESLPDGSIAFVTGNPGGDQLVVVDNPLTAGAAVHRATLPSGCGYRVTAGLDSHIYVSGCGSFDQLFEYSQTLSLIASATVPNASHINALAPDPTDGGVWFSDDRAGIFGVMRPDGTLKTYPAPVGPDVRVVGVASGGGMVLMLLHNNTGPDNALVAVLENGTNCCAYIAPSDVSNNVDPQYFRGGNGLASCFLQQMYWLGTNGNVVRLTL